MSRHKGHELSVLQKRNARRRWRNACEVGARSLRCFDVLTGEDRHQVIWQRCMLESQSHAWAGATGCTATYGIHHNECCAGLLDCLVDVDGSSEFT